MLLVNEAANLSIPRPRHQSQVAPVVVCLRNESVLSRRLTGQRRGALGELHGGCLKVLYLLHQLRLCAAVACWTAALIAASICSRAAIAPQGLAEVAVAHGDLVAAGSSRIESLW